MWAAVAPYLLALALRALVSIKAFLINASTVK